MQVQDQCNGNTDVLHSGVEAAKLPPMAQALLGASHSHEPGFKTDETGVYYFAGPKDDGTYLCSPLYIDAQTRDAENKGWCRLLRWTDPEGKEHIWLMPMGMLAGDLNAVISRLLDGGLRIAQG